MFYQIENRQDTFDAFSAQFLTPHPHIHPHLEVVFLEKGKCLASADRSTVTMESGDLFLAFPNQIHFYNVQAPTEALIFIFSPDLFDDFRDLFHKRIPQTPLLKSPALPPEITDKIKTIHRCAISENSYLRIAAKGYLMALLAEILPMVDFVDCPTGHDSTKSVMIFCLENYTQTLTLDILAEKLHLSKFYISRIFKERMGIGFADFINMLRVEHACELLQAGCSVTDVAFASGFSSIRSFNRLFAHHVKMTPTEYIRKKSAVSSGKPHS